MGQTVPMRYGGNWDAGNSLRSPPNGSHPPAVSVNSGAPNPFGDRVKLLA